MQDVIIYLSRHDVFPWARFIGVSLVCILGLPVIRKITASRIHIPGRGAEFWNITLSRLVSKTRFWFIVAASLYIGSIGVALPFGIPKYLRIIATIAFLFQAGIWISILIRRGVEQYVDSQAEDEQGASRTTANAVGFLLRVILFVSLLLLGLDNLGFNVTTLIAGLGVGGIAVALATQNILGDLFASFSIVMDRPFVIGEFIDVDGTFLGTVENIGLRTTRLRSLTGEQLVLSNNDLIKCRLRNYKRMEERRILFRFGVLYQTSHQQLAAIPKMVQDIIEAEPETRFDRAHFCQYGDSSLDFEVVYYILSREFTIYMNHHQNILLAIFKKFEDEGISFAYPTRTVFLEKGSSEDSTTA